MSTLAGMDTGPTTIVRFDAAAAVLAAGAGLRV
jgi:hypothetical protein